MSSALSSYKEKWAKLSLGLRWAVSLAVLVSVLYLSLANFWSPARDFYLEQQNGYEFALRLQQQVEVLEESGFADSSAREEINLISLVSTTATDANMTVSRMVPSPDNQSVLINIEQTQFGILMQVLARLEQGGIEISSLNVESSSREGFISARASLTAP